MCVCVLFLPSFLATYSPTPRAPQESKERCKHHLKVLAHGAGPDPVATQKAAEASRRAAARTRVTDKLRSKTPDAVDGRKHIDVQTELYLEELSDRVEENDAEAQTDAFIDRPPSPLFVPPKTGIDAGTQILPGEVWSLFMTWLSLTFDTAL